MVVDAESARRTARWQLVMFVLVDIAAGAWRLPFHLQLGRRHTRTIVIGGAVSLVEARKHMATDCAVQVKCQCLSQSQRSRLKSELSSLVVVSVRTNT